MTLAHRTSLTVPAEPGADAAPAVEVAAWGDYWLFTVLETYITFIPHKTHATQLCC